MFEPSDPRRPANTTRFVYLHPDEARELFRQRWASQDVRHHRSGRKRLRHPVVGQLDLDFEALELPSEPGMQLNIYTAAEGTPTSDALKLLASWVASQDAVATERVSPGSV